MKLPRFPLFVPAHRPERYPKAAESGADAVILDLEDAVPAADKAAARAGVAGRPALPVPVIVRINAADSPWFAADLAMLAGAAPDAVMVPKATDPGQLQGLIEALEGRVALIALIESARGLARTAALLAPDGVVGAAFGHLDFAVDLGCSPDWEALLLARQTLVLQSRLAQRPAPLDGVTVRLDAPQAAAEDAARAKALGFGGKLLIHPRQVAGVRQAMLPSAAELDWARRIVAAAGDGGAVQLDGEMIDPPVLARARAMLDS